MDSIQVDPLDEVTSHAPIKQTRLLLSAAKGGKVTNPTDNAGNMMARSEDYNIERHNALPKQYKALHWYDFRGSVSEYTEYLQKHGINDYLDFQDWKKATPNVDPREDWQLYNKWLETIGIAPRQPYNGESAGFKVTTIRPKKADDTFTCTTSEVSGCPLMSASKPKVIIPSSLYNTWIYLAKTFDTEWIAYLKGKRGEDGVYHIESMYFPKQKCTSAHVEAEDGEVQEGTIAAVHSHVDMNVFFSTEDDKHMNHEIELIINRRGEVASKVRVQLECHRWSRVEADLTLCGDDFELGAVTALREKITTAASSRRGGNYSQHNDYGGHGNYEGYYHG
jgi:hypothetical protein